MRRGSWAKGVAIGAAVVGLGLAGCGSDSATEETSAPVTAPNPAAGPPAPGAPAPPPGAPAPPPGAPPGPAGPAVHYYTIVDFIRDNAIAETQLHPGDPGAPILNVPMPPGWVDAGDRTPVWAWNAIFLGDPAMSADPPSMTTLVSKLTGNGVSRVLSYAPGELKNMAAYTGDEGVSKQVSGFPAWEMGGTFTRTDGVNRAIVQTTVVVPAADGVFVIQRNGDGVPEQLQLLRDTTNVLNEQTTIAPPPP